MPEPESPQTSEESGEDSIEEFVLGVGVRLVLDPEGLHLRRSPPAVDLEGCWEDLYAVAVVRDGGEPRVAVTFVDGLAGLAEGRSPATATRFEVSAGGGHAPEALVAAIERYRRSALDRGEPMASESPIDRRA